MGGLAMIDKYEKFRKYKRVFYHCMFISLIFSVFSFIGKMYYLGAILFVLFSFSVLLFNNYKKKLNMIINNIKNNCIKCNKHIKNEIITKYYISNSLVTEEELNTTITSDKKKMIIRKYYCLDCHICFNEIEEYQFNNKNEFILMKKEFHLDLEYTLDKY